MERLSDPEHSLDDQKSGAAHEADVPFALSRDSSRRLHLSALPSRPFSFSDGESAMFARERDEFGE